MATTWISHDSYCYGYYAGQYYDYGTHTGPTGDGNTGTVSGSNYVVKLNDVQWGSEGEYGDVIALKVGNNGNYVWVYPVTPKRVYVLYKDSESGFSKEIYVNFSKYGTSASIPVLSMEKLNTSSEEELANDGLYVYPLNTDVPTLTAPTGKKFKGWNTAADGSGTYYDVGDVVTKNASSINSRYYELTLYAIWEWDGLGNIGGKKALCYICDGHDENNAPIWKQVLPYAYIRNSNDVLDWRLGVGGSS